MCNIYIDKWFIFENVSIEKILFIQEVHYSTSYNSNLKENSECLGLLFIKKFN